MKGTKREHVLMISLHADPGSPSGVGIGGGTHSYLRELLIGLALKGRRTTVVTRRTSSLLPFFEKISRRSQIFRVRIGPLCPIDKDQLAEFAEETFEVISALVKQKRLKPSVIHSVYWHSGRIATRLSKSLGLPFVHTVISNGKRRSIAGARPNHPDRVTREKEIFTKASYIFAVSEQEGKDLVDLYGVSSSKIVVIGRPVDWRFLNPAHDTLGQPSQQII